MMYKNIFSDRLSALRKEKKISLDAVGNAISISNQAVSKFEKGISTPSFDSLCALADYFDVSIDYLVGRSDNPKVNVSATGVIKSADLHLTENKAN